MGETDVILVACKKCQKYENYFISNGKLGKNKNARKNVFDFF